METPAEPVLGRLSLGATVVAIRLRSLGDIVLTTPALQLLRQARPDVWIAVVLDRAFADTLADHPAIDQVVSFDRGKRLQAILKIRALRPELCWNLHGGSTSAWMTMLSGARYRAGYRHFGKQFAYSVRIPRAQGILGRDAEAAVHTAEHHAAGAFYLGAKPGEIPASRLKSLPESKQAAYAVLHVAASHETKRWRTSRFVEIAHWLADSHGMKVRVIAGPGQDQLLEEFGDFDTLAGLNITQVSELVANASLFVGNDSGPAHIAAAYQLPTLVIFADSDTRIWGPWKTPHAIVESQSIDTVGVEQVKKALDQLLLSAPQLLESDDHVDQP